MKRYIRLVLWGTAIIFLVCLSTLIACNLMVVNNAKGKTTYSGAYPFNIPGLQSVAGRAEKASF